MHVYLYTCMCLYMCIHFLILTVCNTAMTLEVQLTPEDSDFISSEWICGNESGEFCVKVLVLSFEIFLIGFHNDYTSVCSQQWHWRTI